MQIQNKMMKKYILLLHILGKITIVYIKLRNLIIYLQG